MTLGEKIAELRKKENVTQEQLADVLGISRQTLSSWENNSTAPDLLQAKHIAAYFKISLDDLSDLHVEIACKNKNILTALIGKSCYIDMQSDDYDEIFHQVCTIAEANSEFVRFSFRHKDKTIEKLVDTALITSFQVIDSGEDQ